MNRRQQMQFDVLMMTTNPGGKERSEEEFMDSVALDSHALSLTYGLWSSSSKCYIIVCHTCWLQMK